MKAAHILEEGIASQGQRHRHRLPLSATVSPLHRGGPMNYADQVGLFNVVQAMSRFAQNPRGRCRLLATCAAAGPAGRRGQNLQLI